MHSSKCDTPQPIKVAKYIKTCEACPTQFNVYDINGQYYYFRYRSYNMSITKNEDLSDTLFSLAMRTIAPDHGECELQTFVDIAKSLGFEFDFSEAIDMTEEISEDDENDDDYDEMTDLIRKVGN